MTVRQGMKAKTAYGTPVTIIRKLKPFKCNGQEDLQRVEVNYHGRWVEREMDMNIKGLREVE